ncbi:MAG: hypothetical protein WBC22_20420 [Sedimentisphaerales bacterium]
MKSKGKIIGFLILVVVICAMIFLAFRIGANNETLGDTGWTLDQFIKWAEKVQPVVGHRRSRSYKGYYETIFVYDDTQTMPSPPSRPMKSGRRQKVWRPARKEWMDPNEPFGVCRMIDADDIVWQGGQYKYEWDFKLPAPYEKLPAPIRKVIDSLNQEDVGRFTGEILPYFARPVAICSTKNDKPIFSEDVEVKLLSLSDDKLEFTIETEPFGLSDNLNFTGKLDNKIFLYSPAGTRVSICRPKKYRKEKR